MLGNRIDGPPMRAACAISSSNEANIRLSIESIGLLETFRPTRSATRSTSTRTAYLFLLSSPSSPSRPSSTTSPCSGGLGVDVQWLEAAEAAALSRPGLSTDGVLAATFCQRDGIADPNGVTMGFAKTAQVARRDGPSATSRSPASRSRRGRVSSVETTRGNDRDAPAVVNRRGSRMHGRSAPWPASTCRSIRFRRHIFIAAPRKRARRALHRACVARHGDRLRDDLLLSTREGRRGCCSAWAIGRRRPTFDTTVQWDFLAAGDRRRGHRGLPALTEGVDISRTRGRGCTRCRPTANPISRRGRAGVGGPLPDQRLPAATASQHSPAAGAASSPTSSSAAIRNSNLAPFGRRPPSRSSAWTPANDMWSEIR